MSILHSVIFKALMKGKTSYDPRNPRDFDAQRKKEIASVSLVRKPLSVTQKKDTLGGIPCEWIKGKDNRTDRIVMYVHGGGFCTGCSEARKGLTFHFAGKLGLNVVSVDYRLAPENPFPAGPEDCFAAYRALLKKYAPERIVLLGESAGGNLVLGILLQALVRGLELPAATFALSPTVQYDQVLKSYSRNLTTDCIVSNLSDEVMDFYLRSHDEDMLRNPIAAPLYGDYHGSTPIVLWASESEVLLDDSLILFEKLRSHGVVARLYLRKNMMHAWQVVPQFRESRKDLMMIGEDMNRAFEKTLTASAGPVRLQ